MVLGPVDMWTPVTVGPPPVWQPANTRLLGGMHACVQVVLPDVKVAADDVVVFLDKQYACADAAEAEQRGAVAALQVGRWQARGGGGRSACWALNPATAALLFPLPALPLSCRALPLCPRTHLTLPTLGQPGQ